MSNNKRNSTSKLAFHKNKSLILKNNTHKFSIGSAMRYSNSKSIKQSVYDMTPQLSQSDSPVMINKADFIEKEAQY